MAFLADKIKEKYQKKPSLLAPDKMEKLIDKYKSKKGGSSSGSSKPTPTQSVSAATPEQQAQVQQGAERFAQQVQSQSQKPSFQQAAAAREQQVAQQRQQVQQGYASYAQRQLELRRQSPGNKALIGEQQIQQRAQEIKAREEAKPKQTFTEKTQQGFREKVVQPVQEKVFTPTSSFVYSKLPWLREPVDIVSGKVAMEAAATRQELLLETGSALAPSFEYYKTLSKKELVSELISGASIDYYRQVTGQKVYATPVSVIPAYTPTQTDLLFRGAAQYGDDGLIYTRSQFVTGKERGVAQSISKIYPGQDGQSAVVTKTYGGTQRVVAKFPDELISTQPQKIAYTQTGRTFTSRELAFVNSQDDLFTQASIGKTFKGTTSVGKGTAFQAIGAGKTTGEFTISAGKLQSGMGTVRSAGVIKLVEGTTKATRFVDVTTVPGTAISSTALKNILTKQIGAGIAAGVSAPAKVSPLVPVSLGAVTVTQIKPVTITPKLESPQQMDTRQSILPRTIQTVRTEQTPRITSISAQAPISKSRQGFKMPVPEKLKQPQIEIPAEAQTPKYAQVPRLTTEQLNNARTAPFAFQPIPPVPKLPIFSFRIPLAKESQSASGKFPVLIRRFGKFKIIGYGKTPGQAVSIGKSAVGYTLARTFKVPGLKAINIAGFKSKVSKKEGQVFIEPSARALSTTQEKKEINIFKELKGGSRKK